MKNLFHNLLKLSLVRAITVFLVASYGRFAYANGVHPHGELALVGYEYLVHIPHFQAVFLCMLSASLRFMVKLEGDTFECASYLDYWSTNPFQLCHHHLVVIGKAPLFNLGAH